MDAYFQKIAFFQSRLFRLALCLSIIAVLFAYPIAKCDVEIGFNQFLAALLIVTSALPICFYVYFKMKGVPLFAVNCLYYSVGLALGAFVLPRSEFFPDFTDEYISFGLTVCFFGLLSQGGGYLVGRSLIGPASKEVFRFSLSPLSISQLFKLGWLLLACSLFINVFDLSQSLSGLRQIDRLASLTGLTLVYYCFNSSDRNWGVLKPVFTLLVVPLLIWNGISTGAIAQGMKFCVLFSFISLFVNKYSQAVVWLITASAILFIFNPVKHEFRRDAWRPGQDARYMNFIDRSRLFTEVTIRHYSGESALNRNAELNSRDSTFDRLNQFPYLLRVIRLTPEVIPYWNGTTFVSLPVMLIPRIVWPDKPERGIANQFGRTYRILSRNDFSTSINTPWLVEFYANKGLPMVGFGMFFIGLFFYIIEARIVNSGFGGNSRIVSAGLFAGLTFPETDLSTMWGGVVLGYVALWLVCKYAAAVLGE